MIIGWIKTFPGAISTWIDDALSVEPCNGILCYCDVVSSMWLLLLLFPSFWMQNESRESKNNENGVFSPKDTCLVLGAPAFRSAVNQFDVSLFVFPLFLAVFSSSRARFRNFRRYFPGRRKLTSFLSNRDTEGSDLFNITRFWEEQTVCDKNMARLSKCKSFLRAAMLR